VTVSLDDENASGTGTVHDTLADRSGSPEESAISNEREAAMFAALRGLSEIYREVIVLCDIQELSYEEISASLGVNIGTVKSRIARGREELRRKLKDF
jgi:RNA polymerase sigma-70 factor, ECF subfamily